MSFVTHFVPDHRLVVVRFSGPLDRAGILAAMQALYHAGAWAPGFSVLWDYRAVTQVLLHPGDFRQIIDFGFANQARGGSGVDVNLINGHNDLHVLISKLFVTYRRYQPGALREPSDTADVATAAAALGLPLPLVEEALRAAAEGA